MPTATRKSKARKFKIIHIILNFPTRYFIVHTIKEREFQHYFCCSLPCFSIYLEICHCRWRPTNSKFVNKHKPAPAGQQTKNPAETIFFSIFKMRHYSSHTNSVLAFLNLTVQSLTTFNFPLVIFGLYVSWWHVQCTTTRTCLTQKGYR